MSQKGLNGFEVVYKFLTSSKCVLNGRRSTKGLLGSTGRTECTGVKLE